jgi:hypothetical protein
MTIDSLLTTIFGLMIDLMVQILPQLFQAFVDFLSQLQQQG